MGPSAHRSVLIAERRRASGEPLRLGLLLQSMIAFVDLEGAGRVVTK